MMYGFPGLQRPSVSTSPYWSASMLDIRAEAFRVRPGRGASDKQRAHLVKARAARKADRFKALRLSLTLETDTGITRAHASDTRNLCHF